MPVSPMGNALALQPTQPASAGGYSNALRPDAQQAPSYGPRELAPDEPTAEPFADVEAQAADLRDPNNPRRAVWLSSDNVEHILSNPQRAAAILRSGVPLQDFDGKGGVLIAQDRATASAALAARARGATFDQNRVLQQIIGALTGAGSGKPAAGAVAVQQVLPSGAVTRERIAVPDDLRSTVEEFNAKGRTVRVLPVEATLARRAALVANDRTRG